MDSGPRTSDHHMAFKKHVFDKVTPHPAQTLLTKAGKTVSGEENEVYFPACIILSVWGLYSGLDPAQFTPGRTGRVCSTLL